MLISIQGGSNLGIFEINDAARLIQEAVHAEANIIFGAVIDDTLGDEVRVTVIAAGFDGGEPVLKSKDTRRSSFAGGPALAAQEHATTEAPTWGESEHPVTAPVDHAFDDDGDDLDVPDFLK